MSLLRATLEATADGLLVVDRQGHLTTFNQRFLTLWKIPQELTARRSDALLIDYVLDQLLEPERFLAQVRELYANPERESFDVLHFKDGRVFERSSHPQRVGALIAGRVWSFRDVTDRELLLARLSFLSDASRLLGSLDVEHALEGVARTALPYLGDACAIDLIERGKPRRVVAYALACDRRFDPSPPAAFRGGRAARFSVDQRPHLAAPMMLKDTLLGVMTFAGPETRAYSKEDAAVAEEVGRRAALAVDNARLLREVQGALRARDEFLSIAAHEIRGPLTSIHLAVQTLLGHEVERDVARRMLALIEREDRRLARFVDDLLDLGRIRAGTFDFQAESVDLAEIVRDAAARLSTDLDRSGSTLSISADAASGHWDRWRLDQVVTNLLGNAIKFGQGRPIDVSVSSDGARAKLVVADQGPGISPDQREKIFEAFQRGVSVQHYGGLGLGLFIVRTIVARLGGTVRVEPRPSGGARFVVELPTASAS